VFTLYTQDLRGRKVRFPPGESEYSGSTLRALRRWNGVRLLLVEFFTIAQLKSAALADRVEARVWGQVEGLAEKATRDGKPFWELSLADAESRLTLRAWSDSPAFAFCASLAPRTFLEVSGEFAHSGAYGLDAKRWMARELTAEECDALLAGSPELRARQAADFAFLTETVETIADPRLRALGRLFFADFGPRFARAAAARGNHHARRGGLVEHVAQMLRTALAIAGAYPFLNRDLLIAGVLFHDCGKMWENSLPADGFTMPFDERGELLGHITIGIELINALWRKLLATEEAAAWTALAPASEDVRLHLLHLLAAHHGELQFGSPVVPKTPEAWALHYVDNLDAKRVAAPGQSRRAPRSLHPSGRAGTRGRPGGLTSSSAQNFVAGSCGGTRRIVYSPALEWKRLCAPEARITV
jgi:3'-5' exoribonuclease